MTTSELEKRRFQRVNFGAWVEINQAKQNWRGYLVDISLRGALVERPANCHLELNEPLEIKVILSDCTKIEAQGQFIHGTQEFLGFKIMNLDFESMTHLRKLIDLNLGDPTAAERELADLVYSAILDSAAQA